MVAPLTVIAQISPTQLDALRQVLQTISADLEHNPYLQLPKSRITHFMRLAIINDPDNGDRLLFTGYYDGELEDYVAELQTIGPQIDEIWNKCEGYTNRQNLLSFIQAHSHKPAATFIAFRDETVQSIRQKIALRQRIEGFLDLPDVEQWTEAPGLKSLFDRITEIPYEPSIWRSLSRHFARLMEEWQDWLDDLSQAIRDFILQILLFVGRNFTGKPERERRVGEYTGVVLDNARFRELTLGESNDQINHLHLLSTIRPWRWWRLRLSLLLIDFAFRFVYAPGTLNNIQSLHLAHWVILDNKRRLLFVTHYDGSWDNYLGDFADRIRIGLNSIWNNCEGYPEAGGIDVVGFKKFFRTDQQPLSDVFYAAYPEATIKQMFRDRRITETLSANFERDGTEDWLVQL